LGHCERLTIYSLLNLLHFILQQLPWNVIIPIYLTITVCFAEEMKSRQPSIFASTYMPNFLIRIDVNQYPDSVCLRKVSLGFNKDGYVYKGEKGER
jgi:hypothetical protein